MRATKNSLENKLNYKIKRITAPIILATGILSCLIIKELAADPIQKFTYHTVKSGESVEKIVVQYKDRYNIDYSSLIKVNRDKIRGLDTIFPNHRLLIAEPIGNIPLDYLENLIDCELEGKEVSKIVSFKDILALMYAETQFNPYGMDIAKRKSNNGKNTRKISRGILQVSDEGLKDVRANYDKDDEFFYDLYLIEDNISVAVKILELIYLREIDKRNKNITSEELFARYNAGSDNVDYWKKTGQWNGKANTIKNIRVIPTRKLLTKVQYYKNFLSRNKK